jgi:hypothetical protein
MDYPLSVSKVIASYWHHHGNWSPPLGGINRCIRLEGTKIMAQKQFFIQMLDYTQQGPESIFKPYLGKNCSFFGSLPQRIMDQESSSGLQIEGVLAYFTHLECQKRIGDDVRDFKYVFIKKQQTNFWGENDPMIRFIHLIMQEYDSKCLRMYLIAFKKVFKIFLKMFAPKINE